MYASNWTRRTACQGMPGPLPGPTDERNGSFSLGGLGSPGVFGVGSGACGVAGASSGAAMAAGGDSEEVGIAADSGADDEGGGGDASPCAYDGLVAPTRASMRAAVRTSEDMEVFL